MRAALVQPLKSTYVTLASSDHPRHVTCHVRKDGVPFLGTHVHLLLGRTEPPQQMRLALARREDIVFQRVEHIDMVSLVDRVQPPLEQPRIQKGNVISLAIERYPRIVLLQRSFCFSYHPLIVPRLRDRKTVGFEAKRLDSDDQRAIIVALETRGFNVDARDRLRPFRESEKLLWFQLHRYPLDRPPIL